jgi:hypothetical protein
VQVQDAEADSVSERRIVQRVSTRPETKSTKDSRRNEREREIMRNLALVAESPRAVKITQKVFVAALKDETGQADRILSNLCMAQSWKGPCP